MVDYMTVKEAAEKWGGYQYEEDKFFVLRVVFRSTKICFGLGNPKRCGKAEG